MRPDWGPAPLQRLSLLIITPCSSERIGLAGRRPDAELGSRFGRRWTTSFTAGSRAIGAAFCVLTDRSSIPQAGWRWSGPVARHPMSRLVITPKPVSGETVFLVVFVRN